jgi:hypothetical protein
MIKNIKRMALLFVAAAALLNVACKKDDNDTKNLVGTSWKFYYEGDVQGMEIVMSDELQIFSADSLNRVVYFEMAGTVADRTNTVHYTWDGTTLSIPDMEFAVTYRASDNVLVRATDDPESVQIMAMLGLDEFLYHQL